MADLYGKSACSPPHPPLESEDMSTFLHHLLHNPSSSSCMSSKNRFPSAPESKIPVGMFSSEDRHRSDPFEFDNRAGEGNLAVVDSSAVSFDFENSGGYFGGSDVGGVDTEVITMRRNFQAEIDSDGYGYDSEKGAETAEAPTNSAPSRSSSKRSRAAEIHNLSEKRRRSRINEKMKALQKLIPNSNKTDKASMLDEAIEYLKQLQLQVQMLSMRNGLSMHPLYVPGGHQPMQLLPIGATGFDENNNVMLSTNLATGSINAAQEPSSIRTALDISSRCTSSNLPINVPSLPNFSNPETPFGFEPEIEPYRPFILSRPSKDFGVEETMPGPQLGNSRSGKINSSSGVS